MLNAAFISQICPLAQLLLYFCQFPKILMSISQLNINDFSSGGWNTKSMRYFNIVGLIYSN